MSTTGSPSHHPDAGPFHPPQTLADLHQRIIAVGRSRVIPRRSRGSLGWLLVALAAGVLCWAYVGLQREHREVWGNAAVAWQQAGEPRRAASCRIGQTEPWWLHPFGPEFPRPGLARE